MLKVCSPPSSWGKQSLAAGCQLMKRWVPKTWHFDWDSWRSLILTQSQSTVLAWPWQVWAGSSSGRALRICGAIQPRSAGCNEAMAEARSHVKLAKKDAKIWAAETVALMTPVDEFRSFALLNPLLVWLGKHVHDSIAAGRVLQGFLHPAADQQGRCLRRKSRPRAHCAHVCKNLYGRFALVSWTAVSNNVVVACCSLPCFMAFCRIYVHLCPSGVCCVIFVMLCPIAIHCFLCFVDRTNGATLKVPSLLRTRPCFRVQVVACQSSHFLVVSVVSVVFVVMVVVVVGGGGGGKFWGHRRRGWTRRRLLPCQAGLLVTSTKLAPEFPTVSATLA